MSSQGAFSVKNVLYLTINLKDRIRVYKYKSTIDSSDYLWQVSQSAVPRIPRYVYGSIQGGCSRSVEGEGDAEVGGRGGPHTSESVGRIRPRMIRGTEVPWTSIPQSNARHLAAQSDRNPRYGENWTKSEAMGLRANEG